MNIFTAGGMRIPRHTFGMGDRLAQEGRAQLSAIVQAGAGGLAICPVWNKSNREHTIVGSKPDDLRQEAGEAISTLGWNGCYYVDADHVSLKNVDWFLAASDFFTLDVADFTGKAAHFE